MAIIGARGPGFEVDLGFIPDFSQLGDLGELFDATESSLGVYVGGGLILGSGRISPRGDVRDGRHFRNVSESDDPLVDEALKDMRYWRGTLGVSFGF
jgi:hypothetical protein